VNSISFDSATQSFSADGKLKYTNDATGDKIIQFFTGLPLDLSDGSKRSVGQRVVEEIVTGKRGIEQATCDILNLGLFFYLFSIFLIFFHLDLGPLFLNVLGLEVDLQEIVLDVTAVTGTNQLVGNLLCAVTGLLDGFALTAFLTSVIQSILDALNTFL